MDYKKTWRPAKPHMWKSKHRFSNSCYCHSVPSFFLLRLLLSLSERRRRRAVSLQENPAHLPAAEKHDQSLPNSRRGPQHRGVHHTHRRAPPGGPGEGGRRGRVRPVQGEAAGLRSALLQRPGWRDAQQGAGPEEEQPAAAHLLQVPTLRAQCRIKGTAPGVRKQKRAVLSYHEQSVHLGEPEAGAPPPAAAAQACSHCVGFLGNFTPRPSPRQMFYISLLVWKD